MAPMAGVTDEFFRTLVHEHGAGLTVSEMVSAKSIVFNNKNALRLLNSPPHIRPWSIQFFGREPDTIAEAIKRLDHIPYDIVDINMGCPMPKIVKNGEGSALMLEPKLIGEIITAAVKASHRPVTIKIRKGYTNKTANAPEIAKIAQESGASLIAVHGRTRDQLYMGEADWSVIKAVKEAVNIPVIGNGDVVDLDSYLAILAHTNCDGVMIGRAAQGNPWIFKEISEFLKTGTKPNPVTIEERFKTSLLHTTEIIKAKGEYIGVREMRKHLCWYVKGLKGNAEVRKEMVKLSSLDEVKALIDGYMEYLER